MLFFYQRQNKAFTLIEILIYLTLFVSLIIVIYPILNNLIGYLNTWQVYQTLYSDFRKISAELQRKSLEAEDIGILNSPTGLYFILQNNTTSYYVSSSKIFRQTSTETVILTSANVIADWSIQEKENVFQVQFNLQDTAGRLFFNATTSLGKLLP